MLRHSLILDNEPSALRKLKHIHLSTKVIYPAITRIAVALYDSDTDMVRTFIYSGDDTPLNHYYALLKDCYSLNQIAETQQSRLEQDLSVFENSKHLHAQKIFEAGFRSSYSLPIIIDDGLVGFIFFNAEQTQAFEPACLDHLELVGNLISLVISSELASIRTLASTMRTAIDVTHFRDPETGEHLQRMAHYSRLIVSKIADEFDLDDNFAEHLFLFAPLHDIGKITIPDEILLKNGKLLPKERALMETHSVEGYKLVDRLLENYHLNSLSHTHMLRNIVLYHHESLDGKGYPEGLVGDEIPIEARVVAVADIFDALTSERPYKQAWSNQQAFEELTKLAGVKLDASCVNALLASMDEVELIQHTYRESTQA